MFSTTVLKRLIVETSYGRILLVLCCVDNDALAFLINAALIVLSQEFLGEFCCYANFSIVLDKYLEKVLQGGKWLHAIQDKSSLSNL